ncbi:MAG: multidrug resistance efflux pump, partial [Chthonomonadales bacterium]|nr:multidrug resistance efflux pump [Chthonomonadales bacterium]
TVNHTSRAFMGVTMHCAKCHDHKYDPVTQTEYYRMRAIFEPYNVRTDRMPGQADTKKDGLVHAFDSDPKVATYLFVRGDERNPDKTASLPPGIPSALGGTFDIKPVALPQTAWQPDKRDFVVQETVAAAEAARTADRTALETATKAPKTTPEQLKLLTLSAAVSEAQLTALQAVLRVEKLEDAGQKETDAWKAAAQEASSAQRKQRLAIAERDLLAAQQELSAAQAMPTPPAVTNGNPSKKQAALDAAKARVTETEKALAAAKSDLASPASVAYKPRSDSAYPHESSGRRLAFARWLTEKQNPLTARVAMNQIWMHHFGVGIVPSVADFGRNGRPPSHPKLLDWLASELMANHWQMKPIHRLIVTSAAYRMASTSDPIDAKIDPDNVYLWRMNSRRMEAEAVRDDVLFVAGQLDETRGGAEIDQSLALTSHRRSLYLRHAAEKQAEFLQIFDGASVTECYERKQSVMPQQALALANSELTIVQARVLARALDRQIGKDSAAFVREAFVRVLSRPPTTDEMKLCSTFLEETTRRFTTPPSAVTAAAVPQAKSVGAPTTAAPAADPALHAREDLALILFNHNDFVTIR